MITRTRAVCAAIFSAILLMAAATGNIRLTQIRSSDLQGNGTKLQTTSVSSPTSNSPVVFDSGGKLAAGTRTGNTTLFATANGSTTSGNCAKWDASGNIVDNGATCGGSGSGGTYGPNLTAPPIASNWTAINQGSCAALADSNAALYVDCPADSATCCNKHIWVKSAPATPWTLVAKWRSNGYEADWQRVGIYLRESATSKIMDIGFAYPSTMVGGFWSSPTSNIATNCTNYPMPFAGTDVWWKVYHNGTNVVVSWSSDGYNFMPFCTTSKTFYATTDWDQIGFGVEARNGTVGAGMVIISWEIS